MSEHKLVGDAVVREQGGITARCECGWVSSGHFTRLGASSAFMDHKEACDAAGNRGPQEMKHD